MEIKKNDFNRVKLVIWDLDDTFWSGTLSEGAVVEIKSNIQLVKELTDRGIINSICSKNNLKDVDNELKKQGILDYFVFRSVDWSPKGQRIAQQIKRMGLRASNCLFIDDNLVNLNEANYYLPDLMTATPAIIDSLSGYINSIAPNDLQNKRLSQYKVLEKKQLARDEASDNFAFLMNSDTRVTIYNDCLSRLDRIEELVARTNQLNYTKRRSGKEELVDLLSDSSVKSGYVKVSDKYGDYGVVGFFAIRNNKCIHFLFSCRTIGQGVEQWVYSKLGYPELEVVGEVINMVTKEPAPIWINQNKSPQLTDLKKIKAKIVFKGACDLSIMASYLNSSEIIEEFTYVGKRGNRIEHQNHSTNYLEFNFLPDNIKSQLVDECVFNDPEMFSTSMYDEDVALVFLSTQIEPMLGIYKRKCDGLKIAALEYCYPLTEQKYWDDYVKGALPCSQNTFSYEWLQSFSEKYDYIGRITPSDFISQLEILLSKLPHSTKVCLLLGSEMPYYNNTQEGFVDRHLYYKELNQLVKDFAKNNKRVYYINFSDYIKSQSDFTDNINHYKRHIYYEAALRANEIIQEVTGERVKEHSKLRFIFETSIMALRRRVILFAKRLLSPILHSKR